MIIRISGRLRSVYNWVTNAISAFIVLVIFLSIGFIRPASADLFTVFITDDVDSFSASFNNVDDAFDQLTTERLQAELPNYNDQLSTARADINYRGLEMDFEFPNADPDPNRTLLTLSIPELNVNESFQGLTRDDSKDLLVEFLEGQGADTVDRIQKELARVSPTDPVAGNPSSLMGQLVGSDFQMATSMTHFEFASTPGGMELIRNIMPASARQTGGGRDIPSGSDRVITGSTSSPDSQGSSKTSSSDAGRTSAEMSSEAAGGGHSHGDDSQANANQTEFENTFQSPGGVLGLELSHQSLDLEGDKANTETLTVEYEYYFQDPLMVARLKMPLAYTDTEGAKSYQANLGVDFSYPVTRSWTLTPGMSYGVGGSEDLGGGASINGFSVTSTYRLVYGDYLYTLGNMIGRYQTGSVSLGDYEINPDISNTVLRNGLVVFRPSLLFGAPTMVQAFFIDTRYSGDELYTEHYYELGFAFGLITDEALLSEDTFHLGLTYLDATDADIKGYKINFGYRF